MLPPQQVMTTQKRSGAKAASAGGAVEERGCRAARRLSALWLAGALALGGCAPAGPRSLLEGEKLMEEGQYGTALEQLRKATQLLPREARAWNFLGLASHRAGLPNDAAEAYQKALTLNPNLSAARFNLGCLYLEHRRFADAARHLASYLMLEPKKSEARLLLLAAQVQAGQAADAEKTYAEIYKTSGGLPEAMNGYAVAQVLRKRTREAAATLYSAVQAKPDYAPAVLNLAVLYHGYLNNPTQAVHYYRHYAALNPRPPFQAQAIQAAAALESLWQAAQTPPAPPPAATNAAPVRPTNATPATPVNLAPNPPPAPPVSPPPSRPTPPPTNALSHPSAPALASAPAVTAAAPGAVSVPAPPGVPRYAYARPAKPAAGDRSAAAPLYQAGEKAQKERRLEDALKNYEAAASADPSFFEAHARVGVVAFETRDYPKALAAYEKALAIQPEAGNTRYNFGLALYYAGFLADAAAELEQAFQQIQGDAAGHLLLANCYAQQLGQPAKARPHYQKALALEPGHIQANAIRQWLLENP